MRRRISNDIAAFRNSLQISKEKPLTHYAAILNGTVIDLERVSIETDILNVLHELEQGCTRTHTEISEFSQEWKKNEKDRLPEDKAIQMGDLFVAQMLYELHSLGCVEIPARIGNILRSIYCLGQMGPSSSVEDLNTTLSI